MPPKAPPGPAINGTTWLITINSNKTQAHAHGFEEAIRRLVLSANLLNFLDVRTEEGLPFDTGTVAEFRRILEKMDITASLEVGEKYQRLHCHLTVTIYHLEHIRIDSDKLHKYFEKLCHYRPNIQIKLLKTSGVGTIRYVNKKRKQKPPFRITSELTELNGHTEFYDSRDKFGSS